jgi:hypothetical protein
MIGSRQTEDSGSPAMKMERWDFFFFQPYVLRQSFVRNFFDLLPSFTWVFLGTPFPLPYLPLKRSLFKQLKES